MPAQLTNLKVRDVAIKLHRAGRGPTVLFLHGAGLGDATEPGAVGNAVTAVYMFCCIPFGLAALLMFRFVRIAFGKPEGLALAGKRRHVSSASP